MSGNVEHREQNARKSAAGGSVVRINSCDLRVTDGRWAFADTYHAEIDAHWERRKSDNPAFFNGALYVMTRHVLTDGDLRAELVRADFKGVLYWRDTGFGDASVADAFGSALIRSAEGHVLLGRQRPGNVNGGLAYLPGGFIDARDERADGLIDIEASIARELAEETGLTPSMLYRVPGFILTFAGPMLSIAVEYRSAEPAEALRAKIHDHIAAEADPELSDVVVVTSACDLEGLAMPAYATVLLGDLFQGG
jgi:8-oxo-dGTP pyrophosphatase MutT (NUDIX family)